MWESKSTIKDKSDSKRLNKKQIQGRLTIT